MPNRIHAEDYAQLDCLLTDARALAVAVADRPNLDDTAPALALMLRPKLDELHEAQYAGVVFLPDGFGHFCGIRWALVIDQRS